MVDVDGLSDAELRTKLMEFGFPVMPITGTTRKVMMKKLKILLENKKKANSQDGRRSLSRYSSEEESDNDTKAKKNRRLTMGVPSTTKNVRRSVRLNDDSNDDVPLKPKELITTKRTTTTTRTYKVQDEYETGSDSEPEIIEDGTDLPPPASKQNNFDHKTSNISSSTSYGFSERNAVGPSTSAFSYSKTPPLTRYSTNAESSLDRLNQIRSRLSLGNPIYDRPVSYSSQPEEETKAETPFLSNFTRRLSQLSSNTQNYNTDIIKEHDTNNGRSYLNRPTRFRDYTRDYRMQHPQSDGFFKGNMVSVLLVFVTLLFFLAIGVMYIGMRSENSSLETTGYMIPYCIASDPKAKKGVNCVVDGDIEDAFKLLKIVKPELVKKSVVSTCTDPSIKPYMTESELVGFAHKIMSKDTEEIEQILNVFEILIVKNPDWDISMLEVNGNMEVLATIEEVIEARKSNVIALSVLKPDLPWRCNFYNKIYAVFNTVTILLSTFIALYVVHYAYKYYKESTKKQRNEVYQMVERIVEILQNNAGEGDDFLVVNHVRDMILPLNQRKRMEKAWDEAVKFIKENESRIRTEIQVVQGEPFEVWRWLGNPNMSPSGSPRSKTWQGQAFETDVGSVNSLPCSPTPCLKVRGMLDENERNFQDIKEAVLSKVADKCRILHCAIDPSTKCVYLKCADQNDAAVAYRNLHGWWYAGHLVTVKYVRLERYMQRFPDSLITGPPFLKASTPATDWTS